MTKLSGTILALLLTTSAVRAQGPSPKCSQATLNGTYVNPAPVLGRRLCCHGGESHL